MGLALDDCCSPRVIRRYANRKLCDATEHRFTSLTAILELVGSGVDVLVHDHDTGIDRTEVVLSQALTQVLIERVGQTEAVTQALIERVRPAADAGPGSSSAVARLLRMPDRAASLAPGANSNVAEELRLLRSELEEMASRMDVLLLEAGARRGEPGRS